LTVIDPHLKWTLRSKLKELHQRVRATMIYVTHDQTEALTFADQVVVLNNGEVVQVGTPVDLFEKPRHTFVGHFIGSPGMNVLPCALENGEIVFAGKRLARQGAKSAPRAGTRIELGVRPEFVSISPEGVPAEIVKVSDAGRFRIVEARHQDHRIKLLVAEGETLPAGPVKLRFDPAHTHIYADGWLVD
jgi:glycerol transport system ATP-binding protein